MFLLVEEAVIKKMIEFIGWEEGDGIFNPGRNSSDLKLSRYKLPITINSMNIGVTQIVSKCMQKCSDTQNYVI